MTASDRGFDPRQLLTVARTAIRRHLVGEVPKHLSAPAARGGGAFVTLRLAGRLRGCIGHVESSRQLTEVVAECAVAAATQDPRFQPVTVSELDQLQIEVSLLGELQPIAPSDVVVGRDGLVVRADGASAVFLPQVAVEQQWSREGLLEHLCRKAGLDAQAWRSPHVKLCRFSAETICEGDQNDDLP